GAEVGLWERDARARVGALLPLVGGADAQRGLRGAQWPAGEEGHRPGHRLGALLDGELRRLEFAGHGGGQPAAPLPSGYGWPRRGVKRKCKRKRQQHPGEYLHNYPSIGRPVIAVPPRAPEYYSGAPMANGVGTGTV